MTPSQHTLGFEWRHQFDAWGTHQPVLYEAIKRTSGPIVELGSGYNSTALIHAVAGPDRKVTTFEHDVDWMMRFMQYKVLPNHDVCWLHSWSSILHISGPLSVVFVDQGLWESRAESIKHFANIAEVVVLHDSDYLERELKINFRDYYKWVRTHMPLEPYPYMTGPPTTIMSNSINVEEWEINYKDYWHEQEQLG